MSHSTTPLRGPALRLSVVSAQGLGLLCAIGALLAGGCGNAGESSDVTSPGEGITRQIAGRWTGELRQEGLKPFEVAVDIGSDGGGLVAYTGIDCGGEWTLEEVRPSTPPRYRFTEKITKGVGGNCKGTGTVSLAPIQGHAPNRPAYNRLNYSFTGGGVTSLGLLHRTDPAHLGPVFKRAGVTPP
jgi:hypothetical protein